MGIVVIIGFCVGVGGFLGVKLVFFRVFMIFINLLDGGG